CGQENHHPQVRTNKHRRRRANAPYPRRDSEHEAAARTSSSGSIVWFLVSLPHKPSGLIVSTVSLFVSSWLELFVRGICYILCVVRHPRKTSRLVGVVEFSVTKYPYFGGLHRLLVLTNPIPSPARFPDFTRGVPCFAAGERTNQPTGDRSYCFALLPSLLSDSAPSSLAAPSFAVPALLSCPSNSYTKRTTQCIWSTYDYCRRQTPFRTPPLISLKLQSSFFSRIPCEEERSGLDNLQATTSTGPSPSGRRGRRSSVSSFNKALPTSRISPHIASSGSLGAKRDYAHPRLHSATCAGELLDLSRAATGTSTGSGAGTGLFPFVPILPGPEVFSVLPPCPGSSSKVRATRSFFSTPPTIAGPCHTYHTGPPQPKPVRTSSSHLSLQPQSFLFANTSRPPVVGVARFRFSPDKPIPNHEPFASKQDEELFRPSGSSRRPISLILPIYSIATTIPGRPDDPSTNIITRSDTCDDIYYDYQDNVFFFSIPFDQCFDEKAVLNRTTLESSRGRRIPDCN
ncbi:hypothetical protein CNYM01_02826, partial [Colletotrichum nymphaeae SA-01]